MTAKTDPSVTKNKTMIIYSVSLSRHLLTQSTVKEGFLAYITSYSLICKY